jgi:plastocyanin
MRRVRLRSIAAVAALAAGLVVAGCGGDDDDGGEARGKTVTATDGKVLVVARDILFEETTINASPGPLEVTLENRGALLHNFVLDDPEFKVEASAGDTEVGTVELQAGRYDYFCSIPGHRAQGMQGDLVVE